MSEKIKAHHLQRKALLYVRQSTTQQLRQNEESRRLQYAMKERLQGLGWREVEVIDQDLGHSASGTAKRAGFQHMVAEVGLGVVGAVGAREVSRFARNSRDWQQLIEICRMVDTLLVDHDAVYDPRTGNDRLLLGMKGTVSEYELDLLRLRGLEAKRAKAQRGEFYAKIAVGYRKNEDGRLEKHPDRRIQEMIELLFDKTLELGSARQVLLWLREKALQLPRNRGRQVVWKSPRYGHLVAILRNPVYAGSYVYGKTRNERRFIAGEVRSVVVRLPREQWTVIEGHHEGYTSHEKFEAVQVMLSRNAQTRQGPGAPKQGAALLVGLLRCRRCGKKLVISYSGTECRVHRYSCVRDHFDHGLARCLSFSGVDIDERVAAELLDVVQPAAIEATVLAAEESGRSHDELLRALRLELEAARYAAERAWRQFDAADPENRLVVDELERRWNDALERAREVEQRFEDAERLVEKARPEPEEFAGLASDLGRIWRDPRVEMRLKKRIVRTLIEEIVVDVDEAASQIVALIHWKGGVHSELRIAKLHRGTNRAQTSVEIVQAVRQLALICDDAQIAAWLSRNDLLTARGGPWTKAAVASLRSQHGIARHTAAQRRSQGWLTKKEAACLLGVAEQTIAKAVERGEIQAMRPLPHGPWIFKTDDLRRPEVIARLEECRARRKTSRSAPLQNQLTLAISGR